MLNKGYKLVERAASGELGTGPCEDVQESAIRRALYSLTPRSDTKVMVVLRTHCGSSVQTFLPAPPITTLEHPQLHRCFSLREYRRHLMSPFRHHIWTSIDVTDHHHHPIFG